MKIFLACAIIFLVSFRASAVFAQDINKLSEPTGGQINEALGKIVPIRFLPNQPFYFSITIKEMVLRFFKPSAVKRAEYDFVLCSKRIKESYFVYISGDVKDLGKSLNNYSKRVDVTIGQIEKARSQNQEISMLADKITEGLEPQEVLLRYLKFSEGRVGNIENLESAISSFDHLVNIIDNVKPGIKDRYRILDTQSDKKIESSASSFQKPLVNFEPTKSAMPRRIIY